MTLSSRRRYIFLVTLAYGLLALAWIFLSDRLLLTFVDIGSLVRLSTAKGIFFVLVSVAGFFLALHAVPAEGKISARTVEEGMFEALTVQPWPRWLTYLFAVLLVAAMVVIRQHLSVVYGERPLLILFILPIVLAALLGGFGPGVAATLTAAALSDYFIFRPVNSFVIAASHDIFQWSLLLVNGLVVSLLSEAMRRSRLREQTRWRQLDTAHLALRQSEERFRRLFDDAPVAMSLAAPNETILAQNHRMEQLFGYTLKDHPTIAAWWQLVHPDAAYRAEVQQRWRAVLAHLSPTAPPIDAGMYRITCKNGEERVVQLFSSRMSDGILTTFFDITERKRAEQALEQALEQQKQARIATLNQMQDANLARAAAEQALTNLRESEERLGLFIEHAPAALAMFDREMRYLAASHRWRDEFLDEIEIIGRSHYLLLPKCKEEWKEAHRRGLAGEVVRCDEDRFEWTEDQVMWLRWEVRPWYTADGSVGGIVIFSEDITRSREAEEEIRRLNADLERRVVERTVELTAANRELNSFAYAVSHDLRAPLRAMNGFSQALIEDFGDTLQGEARLYLDQIILGSRKMGELIDGLLTLSRCTRGQLHRQAVDLSAMAAQLLAEMAREEPARRVRWQIEPAIVAWGDGTMLEVVLRNLLANAWKYTARREEANIRMYTEEEHNRLRVCIADNGAGFEAAHADKLFQPFQRLHRQEEFPGIGIGLATVQRIVHRHGGNLTATGAKEQGAVFCFSLPRHDERND